MSWWILLLCYVLNAVLEWWLGETNKVKPNSVLSLVIGAIRWFLNLLLRSKK